MDSDHSLSDNLLQHKLSQTIKQKRDVPAHATILQNIMQYRIRAILVMIENKFPKDTNFEIEEEIDRVTRALTKEDRKKESEKKSDIVIIIDPEETEKKTGYFPMLSSYCVIV